MKFDPVIPKTPWTKEKTLLQIEGVWQDIKDYNREMNKILGQEAVLREKRKQIQRKIGNKKKYINQLNKQLDSIDSENNFPDWVHRY